MTPAPRPRRYVATPTGLLCEGPITRTPFVSPATPWRTPMLFTVPWHTRGAVNLESDKDAEDTGGPLHYADGTVFRVVDYPPHSEGLMHRTETLDYGVVVEGELVMQLDPVPGGGGGSGSGSGEQTHSDSTTVRPGDIIIQRGTFHTWHNRTPHWARMAYVLVGAHPVSSPHGPLKDAFRLGTRDFNNGGVLGSVVMRLAYAVGWAQGWVPGWDVEAASASGVSESGAGGAGGAGRGGLGGAGGAGGTVSTADSLGTLYVTGHAEGLAVVTSRTPLRPGEVWRTGPVPVSNDDNNSGQGGEGGTVCRVLEIAPGAEAACPQSNVLGYAVVLAGAPTLLARTLVRGDVAVLCGAAQWSNSGTRTARVVVVEVA